MKKRWLKIGLPLILIIVIIAGVSLARRRNAAGVPSDYFTATVTRGALKKVVNATGVVQTVVTVPVGSQVSGQIEELYADYNSVVKRGQLLAKLDTRNLEAQVANSKASVAAAEARLRSAEAEIKTQAANVENSRANLNALKVTRDNAKLQLDRANELKAKGLASANDLDTAKASYDSAVARYQQGEASLQQVTAQSGQTEASIAQAKAGLQQVTADLSRAEINLGYANIFSPVDGVVISRTADVGQTLAASMSAPVLFNIATDLGQMQVNANVDEADIGSISQNVDVTFTVDAYPNDTFHGKIAEIRLSPQTVQNVVTYSVILSIPNPDMKLKPGMTANIKIAVDQRENALKVPNAALRYSPPNTPVEQESAAPAAIETRAAPEASSKDAVATALPQAPGQKWNPNDKLRFVVPQKVQPRPGRVWVLGPDRKPVEKKITLGISDGASTEVIAGDLKDTDQVIIGDSTQVGNAQAGAGFGQGQRR